MPIGFALELGQHVDVDVAAAWGMRSRLIYVQSDKTRGVVQSDKTRVEPASRRSATDLRPCGWVAAEGSTFHNGLVALSDYNLNVQSGARWKALESRERVES